MQQFICVVKRYETLSAKQKTSVSHIKEIDSEAGLNPISTVDMVIALETDLT